MTVRRTRRFSLAVGLLCAVALATSSCGGGGGGGGGSGDGQVKGPRNTVNTAKVVKGGTLTYTITYPISNWNVLSSNGATYSVLDISSVLLPSVYDTLPDGSSALNRDVMVGAKKVRDDPQTIEYTIKKGAVWSDGTPITADDLAYTWRTADPRVCPKCQTANGAGYDRIKSLTPSDGGRTATVVFDTPYVDWQGLFSPFLPAHVAKRYGDLGTAKGLATSFNEGLGKNVPNWSGGPFRITTFTPDGSVIMNRNPRWYGATKPALQRLVFRLVTDVAQQPTSLANGEVNVIYPNPQVDIVKQVDELPNVRYQISPAFAMHQMTVNLNNKDLTKPLRQAIFEAVSVKQMIARTVGQFDPTTTPLLDHIFVQGAPGYRDAVTKYGYGAGDVAKAKQTLKTAGFTGIGGKLVDPKGEEVPSLRFIVQAGDKLRNSEAQIVAAALAKLGITVTIASVPNTVDAIQEGNWSLSVGNITQSAFAATSNVAYYLSCPAKVTFCRFNLGNYGNPKVDELIRDAVGATSAAAARSKLQQADDLISADYAVLPLYQNRSFLAYDARVGNLRDDSLGFPTYNTEQWGFTVKQGS